MTNIYFLDGQSLTIEMVAKIAAHREIHVALAKNVIPGIRRSAEAVAAFVNEGKIAYGITTGFGAFKDHLIPLEQVEQLQQNIIFSHAVAVGNPLDAQTTRAMMLIRANTLAKGYSGIRLETIQLLLDLLNNNILPVIPEKGSLGASGDLAPLAHMALPLIGKGMVYVNGKLLPASEALNDFGLEPIRLSAKEGLALTNGTTQMAAMGALLVNAAIQTLDTANIAAALALEAQNGTLSAFEEPIHQLRPQPFQQETAATMRKILSDSQFIREDTPTNIQDCYSLRCIPQVHGAIASALDYAKSIINIELNSVTDNPLLFLDAYVETRILSGGNFHGEYLALSLDFLSLSLTVLGNISERRIAKLIDSKPEHYPAFLTSHGGLNSGFMLLQYTAAALASENKTLCHPASSDSIPSSGNVEDHVSMGPNAALHFREILSNTAQIIAIELLSAAQAIDFRLQKSPDLQLGTVTKKAYKLIRKRVPFIEADSLLYPYLNTTAEMVRSGEFSQLLV